ncbi:MAG TPA: hypothetical protein PLL33_12895, partial [Paracoccus sp. (in: a-proteobacteria)]|nr:hypothetical protein [Paracoccus sp. (in: a-proteobacteria)]
NDTLAGSKGNDRLEGLGGADVFDFSAAPDQPGADRVGGFAEGTDLIRLGAGMTVAEILADARMTPDGLLLTFGPGSTALLQGFGGTLEADDFVF